MKYKIWTEYKIWNNKNCSVFNKYIIIVKKLLKHVEYTNNLLIERINININWFCKKFYLKLIKKIKSHQKFIKWQKVMNRCNNKIVETVEFIVFTKFAGICWFYVTLNFSPVMENIPSPLKERIIWNTRENPQVWPKGKTLRVWGGTYLCPIRFALIAKGSRGKMWRKRMRNDEKSALAWSLFQERVADDVLNSEETTKRWKEIAVVLVKGFFRSWSHVLRIFRYSFTLFVESNIL